MDAIFELFTGGNFLQDLQSALPQIFMRDFLRYAIVTLTVFVLINGLLSRALRGRVIRNRAIPHGQIKRELITSFRTILIFTGVGTIIWLGMRFNVFRFYGDTDALGWPWFFASIVIVIVLHDAWFYWTHRLIHKPRFFRRYHRTHHKSNNPTPFTAYAFDAKEAMINGLFLLLIGLVLPLSFVAMLVFTTHMMIRNAVGHCGYELFPARRDGRPLFGWLSTVTHHDMHHEYAGYNFGLYFTFWDRAMGTEHPEYLARFSKAAKGETPAQGIVPAE